MAMTEHKRTASIHKALTKRGKLKKIWKINDNYQGGVPDSFYLADDELWIEYKNLNPLPKRPTTIIHPELSEQQFEWLADLQAAGKQAFVVVTWGERANARAWVSSDLPRIRGGIMQAEMVQEAITLDELVQWIEKRCVAPPKLSTRIPDDSFGNGY